MKAAVIRAYGPPNVLEAADIDPPKPAPNEVLIRVEAAGLNRLDHYIREGSVTTGLKLPHVLGSDAVGVVEEVGRDARGFAVGDRVIPMPGHPMDPNDDGSDVLSASRSYGIRGLACPGVYAEYITAPAAWVVKAPAGRAADLATLPMPLVTGVRAVRTVGGVQAGMKVLIHAGASGTGSVMVQIARVLGANVAATVRTAAKRGFVESLGADRVIVLDDEDEIEATRDWTAGRGADVVIDNLGGPSLARSVEAAAPLGVVVLMGNVMGLDSTIPVRSVFFPQKQIRGTLMGDVDDLRWGLDQVVAGRIKPVLDRTFPLTEAAEAHERLARGMALGSIVFDMAA